ncbi:hypothetical protein VTJ83DRAFT_6680 [Remersonia thermophila]|uniref:Uncharacterized protein n=1 Tax=Remersonia thermophila TaxID=72144 RepID=A0ABR4D5H4_9PEZI
MKRWKELGEVPDSDDDEFDDGDVDQDGLDEVELLKLNDDADDIKTDNWAEPREDERLIEKPRNQADVWSLPSSSPHPSSPFRAHPAAQASQILSQFPAAVSSPRTKSSEAAAAAAAAATTTTDRPPQPGSTANDRAPPARDQDNAPSPRPSSPEDDDIPTPRALATAAQDSPASSPATLLSRTPTPPRSLSLPRASPSPLRAGPSDSEIPQQLLQMIESLADEPPVRPQRELRPRKVIQLHPYLIENAKYTTIMKSHGVKPIKVIPDPQPARRRREDQDSQEAEFRVQEDSQEASGEGQSTLEEESGPILFDDDDELGLTPSLPETPRRGRPLRMSSQQPRNDPADITTELSDEEFPPLEALHPAPARTQKKQPLKRQRSRILSSAHKKRRVIPSSSPQGSPRRLTALPPLPPAPRTIWDLSSSPAPPSAKEPAQEDFDDTPRGPTRPRPESRAAPDEGPRAPTPTPEAPDSPIRIDDESPEDPGNEEPGSSSESSGSDSEVVRRHERRIRGVLPASWLRLDLQEKTVPPPRRSRRRSPSPTPERTIRRGVALPRQASPKPSSTAVPLDLFRDSEGSDEDPSPPQQAPSVVEPVKELPRPIVIDDDDDDDDDDDGLSIVEEDRIDPMLPSRKRAAPQTAHRTKKQRRDGAQVRAKVPSWQPKITQVLGRSSKRKSTRREGKKQSRVASETYARRASTPPLLSILDVLEPDAPNFVKIAARSARKSVALGKASPSKKLISLATRADNVDALSVLRDWKEGRTKPKVPAPQRKPPEKPRGRPALRELSTNPASRSRTARPQKLVRQSHLDSFVLVDEQENHLPRPPPRISIVPPRQPPPDRRPGLQPAQLEEEVGVNKRRRLISRKRTLDAFYRSQRIRDAIDHEPDHILDVDFTLREPVTLGPEGPPRPEDDGAGSVPKQDRKNARAKLLKRGRPQQVDVEAPQYARANDPLPADLARVEIDVREAAHPDDRGKPQNQLRGLGPYGTHYTHHFDVFPLDRGVFFHESTLIGRGLVRDAADAGLSSRIRHPRPSVAFSLDGRTLRWSGWDDNVSSEMGILVDWVTEQLASGSADEATARKAIEAADFVLSYPLRALSVQTDLEEKAFVSRCFEILSGLAGRLESIDWTAAADATRRTHLEVAVRFSLMLQAMRSLNRGDPVQSLQLDGLFKKFAALTIRHLLDCGTDALRSLYGDLQRAAFRERGIRADQQLANCWAVMIKLLERAAIPRSSFWDVTQSVMLSRAPASDAPDVLAHERLWRDMFTLLPLTEIDDIGIHVADMRHATPVEGWTLPQQLLKRVFALYQENHRQPPGFNDYCRALVARCHFLVRQWGWRKCTGIVGAIFDFFGSQSLGHLRNEEVYKSPRFLEELDRRPSLSIEPEDRCFHIFIKLLALAIQQLRKFGLVNDVRNLVARTLPNHNRQHLKEDTIHQHELAALRNHHDLLCALFWASPPDLRPAVHLVEKLVVPGSAHKEACLINIRAWGQLARFVISSGEGPAAFRPFAAWRNNVFNQVLEQYLSAASDIEQQFRALANKMAGVTRSLLDDMVAKNKATALDVLHALVRASLDVLNRAPTLEAAIYALPIGQLQKVFTSLDYHSPTFDWGILRTALDTIEHLMWRIDQASEEHYSSEFADNVDAPFLEDAVLLLNDQLTKNFFWMARTLMAMSVEPSSRNHGQHAACVEKTVILAAKIAARLVRNRVTSMLSFFSVGKHCLFADLPKNLKTPERKYAPLFLASLVQNDILDFRELDINLLGLWMLAIVKPQRLLGYENRLGEALKRRDVPFLERATVAMGITPDYNANVDYFACALHHMRRTFRGCGTAQARQHRDEYSKILQLVMQKMREDLGLLRGNAEEHGPYIDFVRQIISLIKSHGVGFCTVDDFFTQPSADYSPPLQDPHLRAAGIVSYGVRLSEKDANAAGSLFHFLYNSFKMALGNDRLAQEWGILRRAVAGNRHVASFMLELMLPAVVRASAQVPQCWTLLEVYAGVLEEVLDGEDVLRILGGGDDDDDNNNNNNGDLARAASLLGEILAWFSSLKDGTTPSLEQLHVMTLLVAVANALRPSLATYSLNSEIRIHDDADDDNDGDDGQGEGYNNMASDGGAPGLRATLRQADAFFSELRRRLEETLLPHLSPPHAAAVGGGVSPSSERPPPGDGPGPGASTLLDVRVLRRELAAAGHDAPGTAPATSNPRMSFFVDTIVKDVKANWVVSADAVMVQMAAGAGRGGPAMTPGGGGGGAAAAAAAVASGNPSLRGVKYGPWEGAGEVLWRLLGELGRGGWRAPPRRERGRRVVTRGRESRRALEVLLF